VSSRATGGPRVRCSSVRRWTNGRRFIVFHQAFDCPGDTRVVAVAGALLVLVLVFVAPYRGCVRYNRFRRDVTVDREARVRFFLASAPLKLGLASAATVLYVGARPGHDAVPVPTRVDLWFVIVAPFICALALGAVRSADWRRLLPEARSSNPRCERSLFSCPGTLKNDALGSSHRSSRASPRR
jgi:hypothetical protein